jgi:hypothetical protein
LDRYQQTVPSPRYGFDVPRALGRVGQYLPEPGYGGIQAAIEINKGTVRPQTLDQLLAGYDFTRLIE